MNNNHRILTYFVPGEHDELLTWVSQAGRRNRSDLGREAFECLRLFGSLETAKSVLVVCDNARITLEANGLEGSPTHIQLCEILKVMK